MRRARGQMSIFKVRTIIASIAYTAWGINMFLVHPVRISNYAYMLSHAPYQFWAVAFVFTGVALGWGAHRSNGIKGRFANRANGIATALALVWAIGFFVSWMNGYANSGLSGVISWSFVAGQMFISARSPSSNPFHDIALPKES